MNKILSRFLPGIPHGCDYNPDQWLSRPDILEEDFRLMLEARLNFITIGIFSWSSLEPSEGHYNFEWLDAVFARANHSGIRVILATPSGGKPNWLAIRHPEVRRMRPEGLRDPQQLRHNHCLTSPVYRERVSSINTQLARRFGGNSTLAMWHVSNEYLGYCYCDLCFAAFQRWLKHRYGTIEQLNLAYWSQFWGHTYTAWEEIQSIDPSIHGLGIDWKRFMTEQCSDFLRAEAMPLRMYSPQIPITTNFHGIDHYNYFELAKAVDIVSWDSYPRWHKAADCNDETEVALEAAFRFDLTRNLRGGQPFFLMESTPSQLNWVDVSPLKRPGLHQLTSLQAVAHGSDAVGYFQFRQGRGGSEKFHGAVITHGNGAEARTFRDVSALGAYLEKLKDVRGSGVQAKVGIIFDWENFWALTQAQTHQNALKLYRETCIAHYAPFWRRGIAVDIVDSQASFEGYTLLIAPMLYMIRGDTAERLSAHVNKGGTLVATYQTGYVNESDLCFGNGGPGPLQDLLGVHVEEYDALPDTARRRIAPRPQSGHGLSGTYQARHYFDLLHLNGAEVLAEYDEDFYAGRPALTRNKKGLGAAYYAASRNDDQFLEDFLGFLAEDLRLPRALTSRLPDGVSAHIREGGGERFLFLLNFKTAPASIPLAGTTWRNVETGLDPGESIELPGFGSIVLCEHA